MELVIDRIPLEELSLERFESMYQGPERPLVITGVNIRPCDTMTFSQFRDTYLPGADRKLAQYDAALPPERDTRLPTPRLVRQVLASDKVCVRAKPMRLWAHPRGHYTLFHYDGNSLDSFNLQLQGRKKWRVVSPQTPLPLVPFGLPSVVSRSFHPSPSRYDFAQFELSPGEMLYLPRYWSHDVESMEDLNLNVNWVWTPRAPSFSVIGRREAELLALRQAFPILERIGHDHLVDYGGDGSVLPGYTQGVRFPTLLLRLAKELGRTPRFLLSLRGVLTRVKMLKENNFKVD